MAIINWEDIVGRYPQLAKARDASEVNTHHVRYAVAELEERLGAYYTVPFSSNNLTAADLAIDMVYARWYRIIDPTKAKTIQDMIDSRIKGLIAGTTTMLTTSGAALGSIGGTVWSTTQDYNPVFDKSQPATWGVSSEELLDNEDARL